MAVLDEIKSKINSIKNSVDRSFAICSQKGALIPTPSNVDNLPAVIDSIPSNSKLGIKLITENGIYNAIDDGLDGYSSIQVDVASAGGGNYNIDVTLNDDNTQSLNIVDYETPTENKLAKVVDRTITEINEHDLQGATSIGNYAFYGCQSLTNITIPGSVTSIGNYTFRNCTSLTDISIPNSVTRIGNGAFYGCTSLNNIVIPENVTIINLGAFQSCTSLTNISIPNSVTSIGNYAFNLCSSLTNITIPSSVTSIGTATFQSCTSLTNIVIPNSVTSIGSNTFWSCTSLNNITIPNSVTSIGSVVFYGCSSLTTMTVLATTPPTLADTMAISSATTSIYVPDESVSAYQSATNWSNFADKIKPLSEKEDI